jgi:hypothetical protein
MSSVGLQKPAPPIDPEENDERRGDEKNVDKATHRMVRQKTKRPKNNKGDAECYEHNSLPSAEG